MNAELERLRKKAENYPSPSVYSRLAELLHREGALDEADRVCRRCIREFPRNGGVYVTLFKVLDARQRSDEAVDILRQGTSHDPRNQDALALLADTLERRGDLSGARAALEQLLSLRGGDDPGISERLASLGRPVAPANAAPPVAEEVDTIDLTGFSSGLTSILRSPPGLDARPAAPAPVRSSDTILRPLCQEEGVLGALILDEHGRGVIAHGLATGRDDLLAAMAEDVCTSCVDALHALGTSGFHSWSILSEHGQVMAFRRRESPLTLVVLARTEVKVALMELKARQALIDLGGA